MRFRQRRISRPSGEASRFANLGMRKLPRPPSATRKQRSENQLILSSISTGDSGRRIPAKLSGLWIRGRREKLSDLFGLRGATCGNLEHRTRRISSPTRPAIPLEIPMTSGWKFQQRTPYLRPARSHRENIAVRYTNSEHDWAWVPNELVHGMVRRKKLVSWSGVHSFCAGIGAMIPHSVSWWCKNGASHRKNFDTPPLRGCCRASRGVPERLFKNE
jgi:hypothetical protein